MSMASRKKKGSINEVPSDQDKYEKELKPSQESPSKVGLQKTTSIIKLIPILILLLASFAVYFNALFGDFVYDDNLILDNQRVQDIRSIPAAFSTNIFGLLHMKQVTLNFYRPMMSIFSLFNYYLFGLKPWGFHLFNILVHCGVSVLVFLIIGRLLSFHNFSVSSGYFSPPFIAAMLFALHPIHTEAVTWISGRSDVFFSFFYLLSFYLYVLFRDGAKSDYILSVLSFSVAIFSKEPAITLPIILIAYDYLLKKSDKILFEAINRYIPYVVVSGIYLLMRYYALGGFAPTKSHTNLSTYESIINVFPLFKDYLTSLLWPFPLNLWHAFHPINSLFEAQGVISAAVAVFFFIGAVAAYRKNRMVFFSLLLFVVPLLPAFYIKGIVVQPFAERYLYLPSVGYVLLMAVFLSWGREKLPRAAKSITIVLIIIWGLYAVGTITRNNVWQNNINLWSDTVKKSPDNAVAHNNLGSAYNNQGLLERAIPEFQAALRLDPDFIKARNNLAIAYESQGRLDMAIEEYQTLLRLKLDLINAHYNLGSAYASQGLLEKAIPEFQAALRLDPDLVNAHYNLALAYASQGLLDSAILEFQAALRLNPHDYEARQRLNEIASRRH